MKNYDCDDIDVFGYLTPAAVCPLESHVTVASNEDAPDACQEVPPRTGRWASVEYANEQEYDCFKHQYCSSSCIVTTQFLFDGTMDCGGGVKKNFIIRVAVCGGAAGSLVRRDEALATKYYPCTNPCSYPDCGQ